MSVRGLQDVGVCGVQVRVRARVGAHALVSGADVYWDSGSIGPYGPDTASIVTAKSSTPKW